MNFEVGVEAHFTASHHLVGDFGPASLPHSHAYRVQISVSGGALSDNGTLFDITRLQQAVAQVIGDLDGTDLNDLASAETATPTPQGHRQTPSAQDLSPARPLLCAANPTAEVMARFFFDSIAATLPEQRPTRLQVRLWESPEAYAGYNGDLA